MFLNCGSRQLDLSTPQIMGILNATPDSFSDGGSLYNNHQLDIDLALKRAEQMVRDGASIIDVGGESTRPGASWVSENEELDRVIPLIAAIKARINVIISVDTSRPQVMLEAAAAGAGLLNDVRGLRLPGALTAAAQSGLPICIMHMQGEPSTMQHNPHYTDVVLEVRAFFTERIALCAEQGIRREQLVLDPGIGFGKSDTHNLTLLKHLAEFSALQCPLLVGLSRKSMIGRLLRRDLPERLPGSLGFGLVALQRGAKILRVHDVAATADIIKIHQLTA